MNGIETLIAENTKLRKILAHVPAAIAIKAKEAAGFADFIVSAAPSRSGQAEPAATKEEMGAIIDKLFGPYQPPAAEAVGEPLWRIEEHNAVYPKTAKVWWVVGPTIGGGRREFAAECSTKEYAELLRDRLNSKAAPAEPTKES